MATKNIWDSRFKVFISYSHADEDSAKWLEEKLEAWRTPKKLAGTWTPNGPIPESLRPVFRDRSTLGADSDLTQALQERIEGSATMVVICSPNAARERGAEERNWIDEEIRHFRDKVDPKRVFALIVSGTPNGGGADECFPPTLREIEPAAADARPDKDTRDGAFIKLLAGILACDPTDLAEKENQALRDRARHARLIAAGMGGLALLCACLAGWGFERAWRAERNLLLAQEAVNTVALMLEDNQLGAQSGFAPHAQTISEALIPFYQSFTRASGGVQTQVDMAQAQTRLGVMQSRGGDLGQAAEHFALARDGLASLVRRQNASIEVRRVYMESTGHLVWAQLDLGDIEAAEATLANFDESGITATLDDDLDTRLAGNLVNNARARTARWRSDRQTAARVGEDMVQLARANVREAAANIEARRDLSIALSNLSSDYRALQRPADAERTSRESCELAAETMQLAPQHIYVATDWLWCRQESAKRLVDAGNFSEAASVYQDAERRYQALIAANPGIGRLYVRFASLYQARAEQAQWQQDFSSQLYFAQNAVDQWAQIVTNTRGVPASPGSLWDSYVLLKGGADSVHSDDNRARLAVYDAFLARFRDLPERFPDIGVFAETVGDAQYQAAYNRERIARDAIVIGATAADLATEYSTAFSLLERAREAGFYGSEPDQAVTLCQARGAAARQHIRANQLSEAEQALQPALLYCGQRYEQEAWDFYLMQAYLGLLRTQGDLHRAGGRGAQARASYLLAEGLVVGSAAENLIGLYTDGVAFTANPEEAARWRAVQQRGSGKRFTVPVTAPGSSNRTPFHIYVYDWGPEYPFEGIEGQALWLERRRGLIIPMDVRESFVRLHRIARENNVSFPALAEYALGAATGGAPQRRR